jgi:hypothetical protein
MRTSLLVALASAALALATGRAWAVTIEIDNLLTNPSFENGAQGGQFIGCPNGWSCSNAFAQPQSDVHVYDPTTAQYASGAPPFGQFAVYVPENANSGSSTLRQITGTNWNSANGYTFTFDIGMPTKTVNNANEDLFRVNSQIRVQLIAATSLQTVGELDITSANAPGAGNWAQYVLSLTPAQVNAVIGASTTQAIEVQFLSSTANGNQPLQVDYDIPTPTPLPGAVWLIGTVLAGSAGVAGWRRKRKLAQLAA